MTYRFSRVASTALLLVIGIAQQVARGVPIGVTLLLVLFHKEVL